MTAADPTGVEPPPVEVFQAFERVNAGETSFTIAQLEAIRPVLAKYHHSTSWVHERSQLEQLLYHVTELLERHQTRSAD